MNHARSSLCVLVSVLLLLGLLLSKVNVSPSSSVSLAAVGFLLEERSRFIPFQSPVTDGFVPRAFPVPRPPPIHCAWCHHFFSSILLYSLLSPTQSLPPLPHVPRQPVVGTPSMSPLLPPHPTSIVEAVPLSYFCGVDLLQSMFSKVLRAVYTVISLCRASERSIDESF